MMEWKTSLVALYPRLSPHRVRLYTIASIPNEDFGRPNNRATCNYGIGDLDSSIPEKPTHHITLAKDEQIQTVCLGCTNRSAYYAIVLL